MGKKGKFFLLFVSTAHTFSSFIINFEMIDNNQNNGGIFVFGKYEIDSRDSLLFSVRNLGSPFFVFLLLRLKK